MESRYTTSGVIYTDKNNATITVYKVKGDRYDSKCSFKRNEASARANAIAIDAVVS